jgi:hypothetical protein
MPTRRQRQANGSASSADNEQTIVDGRRDLANCDKRRQLAVDSWPKVTK